jgi:mono/diheme cytochrome c family protein
MKKVLKWIGIVLAGLLGLLVLAVIGLAIFGEMKFKQRFSDRPLYPITADLSSAGLARGEYLVRDLMACGDCHAGEQGGWPPAGYSQEIRQGPIYILASVPNLTPDMETGLGSWTDAEIARAIREGIDKDGYELESMPAYNYHILSDADVAAIVGYLRSLEAVRSQIPEMQGNLPAKVLSALGVLGLPSVGETIAAPQETPAAGTPEYGAYLASLAGCRDCHSQDFTGGPVPFAEPGTPFAPNLTSNSEISRWTEAEFIQTIQNGVTPTGRTLNEAMPWKAYGNIAEEDLAAIYRYLISLPGKTTAQ